MHDFDLDQLAETLKTAKAFVVAAQQLLPAVAYVAEVLRQRHRRRKHGRSAKAVLGPCRCKPAAKRCRR